MASSRLVVEPVVLPVVQDMAPALDHNHQLGHAHIVHHFVHRPCLVKAFVWECRMNGRKGNLNSVVVGD